VDGAQIALEKALAGLEQLQASYDLVTTLEQADKIGADNAQERRYGNFDIVLGAISQPFI